jgi:hypothetical protein
MALRTKIADFELANSLYVGAKVSFFTVDGNGQSTGQLATLYAAPTGPVTALNPQTLDSEGKLAAPVYIEDPVIAEVIGANVESHTTGVISPLRGTWRGDWVTGTVYRANDFVRDPTLDDIYVATRDYTARATIGADIAASDLLLVFSFSEINADAAALQNAVNTATSSATSASNSATSASSSATSASNSATSASNSATSASNSATSAASSAATAAASAAVVGTRAPQGYLTPTSQTPVITSDVVAATTLYYTSYVGDTVPVWDGSQYTLKQFSEMALDLVSAHAANTIYDVFAFLDGSTLRIGTGPAWSNSGAGTSTRGTGSGTTELERVNGLWVNKVPITARNGTSTYNVDAQKATYLGSILIDNVAGQISLHRSFGQNRRWAVWNAYNRVPIILKGGDSSVSWTYGSATVRPSRNDASNKLIVVIGLMEETVDCEFKQNVQSQVNATSVDIQIGIGINSTTSFSGSFGRHIRSNDATSTVHGNTITARHALSTLVGRNEINALESNSSTGGTGTFYGGEGNMLLSARYRG